MSTVVSAVLKTKAGALVMQQRDMNPLGGAHLMGKVSFFGGHVEPGEPPVLALIRELKEELELSVTASDVKYLGHFQKLLSDHGDTNSVQIFEYLKPIDPTKLEVHEGTGYVLLTREDVAGANLTPFGRQAVKFLLKIDNEVERHRIFP